MENFADFLLKFIHFMPLSPSPNLCDHVKGLNGESYTNTRQD